MKIEVLGCSGSMMKGYNTTSMLVNQEVLVDAGSAASVLDPEALFGIRHILLTHAHIDHIKELPFILESVFSTDRVHGITVWASRDTIDILREHIFNNMVWPDMEGLDISRDLLHFEAFTGPEFDIGDIHVRVVPVEHSLGSVGFLLSQGPSQVLFSGDTAYSRDLFDLAHSMGSKAALFFVEASFPDAQEEIARASHHLTPSMIRKGLHGRMDGFPGVIACHIKPQYLKEVIDDLPEGVGYVTGGEVFEV
ncbi:MAG: MBL fold metallo-hydrolase [Thermodesulfobacteriota bacterium]|nr:MBL fold metallo-hydrolase [Thermodesulfobacteriota bacterium]